MEAKSSKHVESGNVYFQQGDYENAVKCYEQAVRRGWENDAKNNLIFSYNFLGGACFAKEDYKNAIAEHKKALALDPNNADAKRGIKSAEAEIARLKAKQMGAKAGKTALSSLLGLLVGAIVCAIIGVIVTQIIINRGNGEDEGLIRLIGVGGGAAIGAVIGAIAGIFGDAYFDYFVFWFGLVGVGSLVVCFLNGMVKGVWSFIGYFIVSMIIGCICGAIISGIALLSRAIVGAIVKKE